MGVIGCWGWGSERGGGLLFGNCGVCMNVLRMAKGSCIGWRKVLGELVSGS